MTDRAARLALVRAAPEAARLKWRVKALSFYLRSRGVSCSINLHYRSAALAHRWSTAHAIAAGRISLGVLRALPGGRDLDGNRWYDRGWDTAGGHDGLAASTVPAVVANAVELGPPDMAFANEGYAADDPRRHPNVSDVMLSAHVTGRAIDLNVAWAALGGPWSDQACAIVRRFALRRPYADEPWHVETDAAAAPGFSVRDVACWYRAWRRNKR